MRRLLLLLKVTIRKKQAISMTKMMKTVTMKISMRRMTKMNRMRTKTTKNTRMVMVTKGKKTKDKITVKKVRKRIFRRVP